MTVDLTKPSRALDAAVAKAMGYNVQFSADPVYTSSRDWTNHNDYYVEKDGSVYLLPTYSEPIYAEDQGALLGCVYWLARHWACDITVDAVGVSIANAVHSVVTVEGNDQAAFSLAICVAVVKVANP